MSSEVEVLLAERFAEWENPPRLEREVFETDDPASALGPRLEPYSYTSETISR
jgi:hypothetical protein